jgi:ABC-type bacteriocin/lantibiotic exporter with double-glycine peptidase domain
VNSRPEHLSVLGDLARLLGFLGTHWRRRVLVLAGMTLLGATAELLVIGAIVPFLAIIANPSGEGLGGALGQFLALLPRPFGMSTLSVVASLFIAFALAAAVIRLTLSRLTFKFVYAVGHEISVAIYKRIVHQPYTFHIARNSSDSVAAINRVVDITHNMILPLVQCASALTIIVFVVLGLFLVDPVIAGATITCFALIYLIPSAFIRRRLLRNGKIIAEMVSVRIKTVQEGVGGIRDVLLDHAQPVYVAKFSEVDFHYHDRGRENVFMGAAPRFIVESLGLVVIAGLALVMNAREGGIYTAIPVLGALAIGAQRIMPLLQLVYQSWAQIVSVRASFDAVMEFATLDMSTDGDSAVAPLPFRHSLDLEGVGFSYQSGQDVLSDVHLKVERGTRVGFVGSTGSGKSTLIDLIMGLLRPTAGTLKVDGVVLDEDNRRAWQKNIAHVSQVIFLADTSIAQNIAFGIPPEEVDLARVAEAARQAELSSFIEGLPQGFDTQVGERGVRLSGGQRQRIGIARALYKQAPVLILDEATSALDEETESAVMANLHALDAQLTVLIIAHRLSTVRPCDVIYRLDKGRIVDVGSFEEVIGHSAPVIASAAGA